MVKKLKEAREQNKKLKNRRWEIAFEQDLEKGELDKVVDVYRFKNGKINKSKLSKHYGCTNKTILGMLVKNSPHLLCGIDAKYLDNDNNLDQSYDLPLYDE